MKREDYACCDARSAAERLGISEDEVELLIDLGELRAVTFMDDPRSFVVIGDVEKLARQSRSHDMGPWGKAWRNAESRLRLARIRNAIF